MKLDMALLCDAVSIREGLIHILGGGVTRIWTEQFPTAINATLALRILVAPEQAGESHAIKLVVRGPEGDDLGTFNLDFGVNPGELSPGVDSVPVPLAIPMGQVALPEAGQYRVEVVIDDETVYTVPVEAALRPQTAS